MHHHHQPTAAATDHRTPAPTQICGSFVPNSIRRTTTLLFACALPLIALQAQSNYATPGSFTTLAAPAAWFAQPTGVAVDPAGNIYVAEANTIRKITAAGVISTLAGSAGIAGSVDGLGAAARFNGLEGIAADSAGNVYAADTFNHTIRKISPAGVVTTLAGLAVYNPAGYPVGGSSDGTGSNARFNVPSGVAVDGAGTVYVADNGNYTIRKITPAGVVTTLAGTPGGYGSADGTGSAARFSSMACLAVDSAGNLYAADFGNETIRKITPAGVVTTLAGHAYFTGGSQDGTGSNAWFDGPYGIAVNGAGMVYVADSRNNTIRQITPAGVVTTLAGSVFNYSGAADGPGTAARFHGPWGVAVDAAGTLYVTDSGNNAIRQITPAGVVTTLTGSGAADGTGRAALFDHPTGVAVDRAGTLYVADKSIRRITTAGEGTTVTSPRRAGNERRYFSNSQAVAVDSAGNLYSGDVDDYYGYFGGYLRKVTPAGEISTLAGTYGFYHDITGRVTFAPVASPAGVAVDSSGIVYVVDSGNNSISKFTATGLVTLAGTGAQYSNQIVEGSVDGTGTAARFRHPSGIAVDAIGNLYVADTGNHTVRKITPAGVVTTLAGTAGQAGSADGSGNAAQFNGPADLAVDSAGNVYVADTGNHTIRRITPAGAVTTVAGVAGQSGNADGFGRAVLFNAPRGVALDAAGNLYVADTGNNTIRKGVLSQRDPNRLLNISTRAAVGTGDSVAIAGFVISGTAPKQILIRAAGPALNGFGLPGYLPDPELELHEQATDRVVATNDNWEAALAPSFAAVGAFAWTTGSKDAALLPTLNPGAYSVIVKDKTGQSGIALVEVYDADNGGSKLTNLSTRSPVGIGDNVQIAGFVVGGATPKQLVIRAAGPALIGYGLSGILADPMFELHNQGTGAVIATTDNWAAALAADFAAVGAFSWTPGSRDAALVTTLDPGVYTVVVKGNNNGTGIALVEVYEEP